MVPFHLNANEKAAIVGMTKTAAKELGGRGITVNAIAPGFIETDMTAKLPDKPCAGCPPPAAALAPLFAAQPV